MTASRLHILGGSGRPVLLLHGFGADRLSFLPLVGLLQDHATLIAPDLPGHGGAGDAVDDGTPAALAADLAAALDLRPEPMVVVGHSLGGAVALHLAALRPALVRALVLIAPAGLGDRLDGDFLRGLPALADAAAAQALLERLVVRKRLIAPAMANHLLAGLAGDGRRPALAAIARGLEAAPPPPYPPAVPTTVIWGEADAINPLPADAAARFGAALVSLPDTGHLPQAEAPRKVADAIRARLG